MCANLFNTDFICAKNITFRKSELVICCQCIIVRIKKTVGDKGTVGGMREVRCYDKNKSGIRQAMAWKFIWINMN